MINILILKDDDLQLKILDLFITEYCTLKNIPYKINFSDINKKFKGTFIDVAFISIANVDNSLIKENIKHLSRCNPNIPNIFYGYNAVHNLSCLSMYNYFDFIQLPLDGNSFGRIFTRSIRQILANRILGTTFSFCFTHQSTKMHLKYIDTLFIYRNSNKTIIMTKSNKSYETYETIKSLNNRLVFGFARVSQSLIVNLSEIKEVKKDELLLKNGYRTKISKTYKSMFFEKYERGIFI